MGFSHQVIAARSAFAVTFFVLSQFLFSQEFSAGINIENPNRNAVLHLVSPGNDQGLLIPKLTNGQRNGMNLTTDDEGLMVYDEEDERFYFWSGTVWIVINVGNSNGITSVASDATLNGDGTGGNELSVNVGTGANQIVQLDGTGALPGVNANALTDLDFNNLVNVPANLDIDRTDDVSLATFPDLDTDATDDVTIITAPAAGDITGDFQSGLNINIGVVSSLEITDGTIQNEDINDVDFSKLTNIPTDLADGDDVGVADLTGFDTDDLTEGVTNLYYTDARADARIAAASVTSLTDVTNAGSGEIITAAERTQIGTNATNIAGLGTASTEDVGTGPNNVVQLNAASELPAVDGSNLTGVVATGLGTLNTDDLTEGVTNLYYTDARADARIAAASVTSLTDVTNAGSGEIITAAERTSFTGAVADLTTIGNAGGTLNAGTNLVDWSQLKNVPGGLADGVDDTAGDFIVDGNNNNYGQNIANIPTGLNNVIVGSNASSAGVISGSDNILIGTSTNNASGTSGGNVAIGNAAQSNGGDGIAIGTNAQSNAGNSLAIGRNSTTGGLNAISVGNAAISDADNSIAIGTSTDVNSVPNAIVIGNSASVSGISGVALGLIASAADNGVAIGIGSSASANSAVAIGNGAEVTNTSDNGVALGPGATVDAAGAVAIGVGSNSSRENTVTLGSAATPYNLSVTGSQYMKVRNIAGAGFNANIEPDDYILYTQPGPGLSSIELGLAPASEIGRKVVIVNEPSPGDLLIDPGPTAVILIEGLIENSLLLNASSLSVVSITLVLVAEDLWFAESVTRRP